MKKKLIIFLACLAGALILAGGITAYLDPFMVYHAPLEDYYYTLDNQRYQSPGIIAFYDYDAMIAGTSLTQNFFHEPDGGALRRHGDSGVAVRLHHV